MKFWPIVVLTIFLLLAGCFHQDTQINPGSGHFVFRNDSLCSGRAINVFTYRPKAFSSTSPVLIVIHGNRRNADTYRDQWIDQAEKYNALLLAPQFSRRNGFPQDSHFNMGNVFTMNKQDSILAANPENDWAFSLIDPVFEYAKKLTASKASEYYIYGHSAGSQFVHRFLYFKPDARVRAAACANAGWYTMPDFSQLYPYGLKATSCTRQNLQKLYARRVAVCLGENDTVTTAENLRRTPEAMMQGKFRLERGLNFFRAHQHMAAKLQVPFNWSLITVPGARHSNRQMKIAAAGFLFASRKPAQSMGR